MSRIGKHPIAIPAGVDVTIDGSTVTVKGPKGTLTRTVHSNMNVAMENGEIVVTRPDESNLNKSLHGLTRTLIHNMVVGVTDGFKKELEINGVGYRAAKQGSDLVMNIGYSHQVIVPEVDGITIEVPAPNKIVISGPDKQQVGQFAAEVRESVRRSLIRARASNTLTSISAAKKAKPVKAENKKECFKWLQGLTAKRQDLNATQESAQRSPEQLSVLALMFSVHFRTSTLSSLTT